MRSRPAVLAAALAALVVLAGCGGSRAPAAPDPTGVSGSPSPTAPASSPTPVTPLASARTPLGAGQRVWAAFSAKDLAYDAWWAQLKPLLSDAAQAVYVYDDPRNLPTLTLTGSIRLARKPPAAPRYTAEVIVPTSRGRFALDLERHTLRSPWLLYAIKFPPGVQ